MSADETPSTEFTAARHPAWPDGGADALERDLLARWDAEGLFQQVQAATADGEGFVFFEGPPTANGRPGIHHVFSRTIKDLICRYQAMQGKRVTRIAGWDTHGLPVELEVEKQLGFAGKKDIEAYGVAEFSKKCLESVFTYRDEWVQLSNRTGYWLDYDNAYVTCTKEYVESVWWLLQRLFQKELLYRGHRVSPYCPRCGTVLSSHELALGYQEVKDKSVYVTFPLSDGSGRELVVWTTTPWTLPSNVAVAVNPELEYAEFTSPAHPGRTFVLAASRAAKAAELLGEGTTMGASVPGAQLAGLRYARPFGIVTMPADGAHSIVVTGAFVTADDGSGLVHMAPAFGADDYAAGREHGLALVRPVAGDGTFVGTSWPELNGQLVTADDTNEMLIRKLKELGRHLKTEQYIHSYPHCWRCHSKLIYYARESWFVRTSSVKARMQELNAGISWHPPEVGTGRFGEWLGNNIDWALSRERYWGTPLPIWVSDRDPEYVEVIGSFAELKEKAGFTPTGDLDVHKPWVDEITWPAPGGGTMRRVPEVIDTWFDSGSMPYAQWHYPFENVEQFERHFPADYICEGIDQTRGWFYSLLAIGTAAFDAAPYRNVIVNELVLDASGHKMSKSKGNVVDPWKLVEKHGADAARLYMVLSSQVWQPKRFDERQLVETAGGFLNTLRASYHFFSLYAGPDGAAAPAAADRPLADRWLLGRLDATVAAVRAAFDGYDVTTGVRALTEFVVDDLSNWWVRLNRGRFWAPGREADPSAVATMRETLVSVSRLLAPAAPFASDWLHRAMTGTSVHLAPFPVDAGRLDPALDRAMDGIRRLASLGRAARETASLRVRQPLATIRVAVPVEVRGADFDALIPLLQGETNVKRVEIVTSDADLVRLRGKPNFRTLGKRFGAEVKGVAASVALLTADQLRALEQGETVTADYTLLPEDVTIEREVVTDWPVASAGPFVVALDPVVTPALAQEGLARELVSRVQRLRKDAGFAVSARIALSLTGDAALLDAARVHQEYIAGETLAREFTIGEAATEPDRQEAFEVEGHAGALAVRQLGNGRTHSGPAQVNAS
ncbi:MAG: isoleucine--tRNA ligase [Gemmatimonadetes bacterium]|nr:isoleucine--tRNA ligase [Gemmatimonadota bacterium]